MNYNFWESFLAGAGLRAGSAFAEFMMLVLITFIVGGAIGFLIWRGNKTKSEFKRPFTDDLHPAEKKNPYEPW